MKIDLNLAIDFQRVYFTSVTDVSRYFYILPQYLPTLLELLDDQKMQMKHLRA